MSVDNLALSFVRKLGIIHPETALPGLAAGSGSGKFCFLLMLKNERANCTERAGRKASGLPSRTR
jgi:hypothetical protein